MSVRIPLPPVLRDIHELRVMGVQRLLVQALLTGAISGAVIGLFRLAYTVINTHLAGYALSHDLGTPLAAAWVWSFLGLMALLAWLLLRYEPLISGSGIPQTELALAGHLPMPWGRLLWAKFAGTLVSLSGGLSLGREGPCIQMGAAVGCGVGHLWHDEAARNMPRFLVGGSVAGLTAAFGAPVAGLCFAFEEMRVLLAAPILLFTSVAALGAWFVVDMLFGFGLVFPFRHLEALSLAQYWLILPAGLAMGLLGVLYNALLVKLTLAADRCPCLPRPVRTMLPFALAGLLLYVYPQVLVGLGPDTLELETLPLAIGPLALLLTVKILFSCLSFASGVAGGLLMPMLLVGALAGACGAWGLLEFACISPEQTGLILCLCMAGLFAATVRAPLTGAALLVEMSGAFSSIPAIVAVALLAAFTANKLGSPPVYDSLKERILAQQTQQKDKKE
ncbi:MAG: chloride channel protein [Desulfovibrionaceae bacterium]|nr:chloride channel protein [Desulfovibrionaceae bacterium]